MGKSFDALKRFQQAAVADFAKKRLADRGFTDATQAEVEFLQEFIAADAKDVKKAIKFCDSWEWIRFNGSIKSQFPRP